MAALQVHSETDCVGEQLVVLQSRQTAVWNKNCKNVSRTQLWASVSSMERSVSALYLQATKDLLPFPTRPTYFCEAGFCHLKNQSGAESSGTRFPLKL